MAILSAVAGRDRIILRLRKRRLLQQVMDAMRRGVENEEKKRCGNYEAGFTSPASGLHIVDERSHDPLASAQQA